MEVLLLDIKKFSKDRSAYLRNYSQTLSLDRLADPDSEFSSELTAGGDISINKDESKNQNK